jgi:RimJ/RimL family protein N-acetyltransferase
VTASFDPNPVHPSCPALRAPLGDVTTARLDLRRFTVNDLDELASVFSIPEVWEFPFGRGLTYAETEGFLTKQVAEWDDHGLGLWAARERTTGALLGLVGLAVPTFLPEVLPAVEVGWRLSPSSWGMGYATEGAVAALHEAFTTLDLEVVCSIVEPANTRSVRVEERLGMRLARTVELPANERRGAIPALFYEMTRSEWSGSPWETPVESVT